MKCILSVSILFAAVISCNLKTSKVNMPFKTIVIDTLSFERIQQATKNLNYSSLTNGVDSLELRLWTGIGHTDYTNVRVIKYEQSNWHQSEMRYWLIGDTNYPNEGSKTFLDSGHMKSAALLISYKQFVDSILVFHLNTFPTQSQIPGFRDNGAGGYYYDLEIATRSYYKHLFYHQPEQYNDSSNLKFGRILKLLRTKSD